MRLELGTILGYLRITQGGTMSGKRRKRSGTLSERQKNILEFFVEFQATHSFPPTIREIGKAVGISSTSVVNYNLNRLEEMGYIEREESVSRGLRLLGPALMLFQDSVAAIGDFIEVPMLGRIVASAPAPVPGSDFEYMPGEYVSLARGLVKDERDLYALQVEGDSMVDALVDDGDIVIMRRQHNALPGDMVAVWLHDREETTLKKFYQERDKVRLQPANPYMDPIYVDAKNVEIQGKVMLVIRQLQ
jgi:repressor LexA